MSMGSFENATASGQFCGTTEAARILGLSVGTVQSLVERQELMAWKTRGGHRRISMMSVQEYQRRNHSAAMGGSLQERVMWIQESGSMRQKLMASLSKWGVTVQVDWFENMFEASIGLQNLRPGMIVIDLKTPQADALQFIRHVHQQADFRAMTVLALCASRLPDDVMSAGLGAQVQWIRKPLDWSWLRGYFDAYQMLKHRQPMH